jgi:predicted nucleotide-binding protein (sugar kinase/HSP70/actin superfamily)
MLRIIRPKRTSQIASKVNGDNLNNIRCETSRHFRNKMREYLKDKIDELAKNKNIRDLCRGINDFKRGYQPTSNLVICLQIPTTF